MNGKRMTAGFLYLLAFALFLTGIALPVAEAGAAEQVYSSGAPIRFAVAANGVWIVTGDALYFYRDDMLEPEKVADAANAVQIASGDSCLYYITEAGGGQDLNMIYTGGTIALQNVALQRDLRQIEFADFRLWGLDADGVICSVYEFEGSVSPLEITGFANRDVTAFSVWKQYIAAYRENTGEIVLCDTAKNTVVTTTGITQPVEWIQVLDVTEEAAYVAIMNAGKIYTAELMSGTVNETQAGIPADCAGLQRNAGAIYTLGNNGKTLYRIPISVFFGDKAARRTLTVVNSIGDDRIFEEAVKLFGQRYPDVEIVERWIDDPRIIATEVMAGGEGVDLIGMQESMMPISSGFLMKSGAIVDLNSCPGLTDMKGNYRDVFGMATVNGKWYGVPESIGMRLWQVNPELAAQVGWEIPEGRWTWDDFTQLAEAVRAYNQTAEKPIFLLQEDSLLLPYFFHEYQANHMNIIEGTIDFDSDTYRALLDMWKRLNDEQLICGAVNRFDPAMRGDTLLWSQRQILPWLGDGKFIYPPTETTDSGIPVYCSSLVLNAHSPMAEEAAYFLECLLDPKAMNRGDYWLFGQLLSDEVSDANREGSAELYHVSPENEQLWNAMLTVGIPELYLYDIQREQSNTLMPGLLEGRVGSTQFAMISQQLADMALGE